MASVAVLFFSDKQLSISAWHDIFDNAEYYEGTVQTH